MTPSFDSSFGPTVPKEKPPTSSSWVSTGVEIFPPDIHVRTGEDRDVGDVTSQVLVLAVRVDV